MTIAESHVVSALANKRAEIAGMIPELGNNIAPRHVMVDSPTPSGHMHRTGCRSGCAACLRATPFRRHTAQGTAGDQMHLEGAHVLEVKLVGRAAEEPGTS